MKQIREIWNMVFEWLGPGKKLIMGAIFVLCGSIINVLLQSAEGLTQGTFLLLAAGALFWVNALFSKLTNCNINVLCFTLIFIVIYELGMFLMGDNMENTLPNLLSVWAPCFVFVWALQYVVLEAADMDKIAKRIVIAFFETVVGVIAIVAAFIIPVWIAA